MLPQCSVEESFPCVYRENGKQSKLKKTTFIIMELKSLFHFKSI